jgi:hypothetical protein
MQARFSCILQLPESFMILEQWQPCRSVIIITMRTIRFSHYSHQTYAHLPRHARFLWISTDAFVTTGKL